MTEGKYRICPRCRGEGEVWHPACNVWTRDDIEEDPEGFEMMRRGELNVPCPRCRGTRVVTAETEARYAEDVQDARVRAMEDGDWETLQNGVW